MVVFEALWCFKVEVEVLTVVLQSSCYTVCHDVNVAVVVTEAGKRRLLPRFILVSSAYYVYNSKAHNSHRTRGTHHSVCRLFLRLLSSCTFLARQEIVVG